MTNTRRDFMAQCLGGLGIAVVGGVPEIAAKSPKTIKEVVRKGAYELEATEYWSGPKLRVETDLTPLNTKVIHEDGRNMVFIDELLVQWFPRTGRSLGKSTSYAHETCWVGMGFMSIPADKIDVGDAIRPRITWGEPNRNSDVLPFLADQAGNNLPLQLAKCEVDHSACLYRGFAVGFLPVQITTDGNQDGITFMHCSGCGYYDRALEFDMKGWEMNTAQRGCPRCHEQGRQQVDLGQELVPYKLHMTPETSILVCHDKQDGDKRPSPMLLPEDLQLANRPMWMAKEAKEHPMAQIVPDPSPLNDLFLSTYAPLFGGVVR
jgi:hypothetical protein